jgi:hypothetical protein
MRVELCACRSSEGDRCQFCQLFAPHNDEDNVELPNRVNDGDDGNGDGDNNDESYDWDGDDGHDDGNDGENNDESYCDSLATLLRVLVKTKEPVERRKSFWQGMREETEEGVDEEIADLHHYPFLAAYCRVCEHDCYAGEQRGDDDPHANLNHVCRRWGNLAVAIISDLADDDSNWVFHDEVDSDIADCLGFSEHRPEYWDQLWKLM